MYSVELLYNLIEALLITFFCFQYFEIKPNYSKSLVFAVFLFSNLTSISLVTFFDISWLSTFAIAVLVLIGLLYTFFEGVVLEQILVSFVVTSLLALTSIVTLTLMSKLLSVEFGRLVNESSIMRFVTIIITKLLFVICMIIIISFKKKQIFMLRKAEYLILSATFVVSGIIISIVRNMIYEKEDDYNAFLILVMCLLCLNIGQYYSLVFISNKNSSERKLTVMKKQLELQEISIHNLEKTYEETSKIRHDIKNHLICALELAENAEYDELKEYLHNLSGTRIHSAVHYVHMERKAIGAVINSKFALAESKGIYVKCVITDEMNNIEDIDAAILLSNLLDNAIEACEKNIDTSDLILKIWNEAGYYCIDISNSVECDILKSNPELITSKKDKNLHGLGLQTVRDIVEKYDGMISFIQKNNMFHVCISLIRD